MTKWLLGPPPPRLAALHGFTQRGSMFAELAGLLDWGIWAPDLPGHGMEAAAADWEDAVARTADSLRSVAPLPLLGYSQGGRLALGVAVLHPELVTSLILISASPGIEGEEQRAARRRSDERLADHIEQVGSRQFLAEWMSRAMFAGVQERDRDWLERDRELRHTNTAPGGLASSLRAYGAGSMPFLGDRLADLSCPVTLVVGSDDAAYRTQAFELAQRTGATLRVIGGAGHALVAEAPLHLADVVHELI